jgi:septal ring factor EnvC (AmiA/AmiB activator)
MSKDEMDTQPTMQALWEMMTRRFDRIDTQQAALKSEMDARFDKVEAELSELKAAVHRINTTLKIIASDIQGLRADLAIHDERLTTLEAK